MGTTESGGPWDTLTRYTGSREGGCPPRRSGPVQGDRARSSANDASDLRSPRFRENRTGRLAFYVRECTRDRLQPRRLVVSRGMKSSGTSHTYVVHVAPADVIDLTAVATSDTGTSR